MNSKEEIMSWLLTHAGVESEPSRELIYNTLVGDRKALSKQKILLTLYSCQTPVIPSEVKQTAYILCENYSTVADMIISEIQPKVKKAYKSIPPTLVEVITFFTDHGYTEELARRAYEGYQVNNWIDSRGKPVRNWRQKMVHVWFKPENKTKTQSGTHPGQVETTGNVKPTKNW